MSQPTDPTQPQPSQPRHPEPAPQRETRPETQAGPVRQLRVRRSPKYAAFIFPGALVGLCVAVLAGGTGAVDPQTSRLKLIGYLGMALVLLGGLIGAGIAVAIERFSQRSRLDVHGR